MSNHERKLTSESDWHEIDTDKEQVEKDMKRQETIKYMQAQKAKLNIKDLNQKNVMGSVRDLYIEKMAANQAEKKPLGNVTTSLTLKNNTVAQLKPIQESFEESLSPNVSPTHREQQEQMKPYVPGKMPDSTRNEQLKLQVPSLQQSMQSSAIKLTEQVGFDKGIETNEPTKHVMIETSQGSVTANSGRHGSDNTKKLQELQSHDSIQDLVLTPNSKGKIDISGYTHVAVVPAPAAALDHIVVDPLQGKTVSQPAATDAAAPIDNGKIKIAVESFPQHSEAEIGIHAIGNTDKKPDIIQSGREQQQKFDDLFPEEAKQEVKITEKAAEKPKKGGFFGFFKKKQPVPAKVKEEAKQAPISSSRASALNNTAMSSDPLKHEDIDIESDRGDGMKFSDKKGDDEADPANPKTADDKANPNHVDIHYDVNGNYHKAEWNEDASKKVTENCCFKIGKRLFKQWYPYYPVKPQTDWAKKLHFEMLIFCFLHCVASTLALTVVGFEVMVANMILGLQAYSCSLTFGTCSIYLYFFFLLNSLSGGLTWVLSFSHYGSGGNKKGLNEWQEISILGVCVMYVIIFLLGMASMRKFRKSGGANGQEPVDNLFEDKILVCMACCCKHAKNAANGHLDKQDAKTAELKTKPDATAQK